AQAVAGQRPVLRVAAEPRRRRAAALPDGRLPRAGLWPASRRHRPGQPLVAHLPFFGARGAERGAARTLARPPARAPGRRWRRFQERAADLVTGPEARRAFDLGHESARVRERYGRHPLGQNLLMARRLIEAGVRLVSVTAWAGTPASEKFRNVQTWDMHGDGAGLGSIFGTGAYGLGWALPNLRPATSALLVGLEGRG